MLAPFQLVDPLRGMLCLFQMTKYIGTRVAPLRLQTYSVQLRIQPKKRPLTSIGTAEYGYSEDQSKLTPQTKIH
jgi:hypothetical protein